LISFVDITPLNRQKCAELSVWPEQASFVASNAESLAEAEAGEGMTPVGISADGCLVGFAMYGNDPDKGKAWIIRFMIDKARQRRGYGAQALDKLIKLLREKYGNIDIRLCVEPENEVARGLYGKFGFAPTGEVWDNELIFELRKKT